MIDDNTEKQTALDQAEAILEEARANDKPVKMFSTILARKRAGELLDGDNERALVIRDHCLLLARALNGLLERPVFPANVDERSVAVENIGKEIELLRKLGLKPDMHTGDSPKSFEGRPLKATEFVASGLFFDVEKYMMDFVFHPNAVINRMMQANVELADIYLGNYLGLSTEKMTTGGRNDG